MIVTCPSCAARYRLKDSKVTGRGAKITCPTCSHVFVVYPEQEQASQLEVGQVGGGAAAMNNGSSAVVQRPMGAPAAPVAPPDTGGRNHRSAESLDFRKVGINAWKVKVKIGLTYDFADIKTLRKFIQDGRVTGEDKISHDGRTWVTIGDIPDLDAYFIDIYEKAEADLEASRSGGGGFEDDDAPTMIVGMSTLSNDLAADALRQATSSTDGISSDPPSPLTPSSGGQFVDPFAALKSKQRERIQQRRSATAAPAAKPEKEESSRGPLIVVVLLLAALGAGWWYTQQGPGSDVVDPGPGPAVQPKDPGEKDPVTEPNNTGAADDLRRMVEETLQEGENDAPPLEDEQVLIPIGPRGTDGRPSTNPNPSGTNGGDAGVSVGNTDHAANCRQFAQNRDWSQATMACSEALKTRPGDAALLTNHGIALYETGQRDAAAAKLRQAERQGVAAAKKYLGHIARDNGDVAGAVGHYRAYLATNPADSGTIQAEIDRLTGS